MRLLSIAIALLTISTSATAMGLQQGGFGTYTIDRTVECLTPGERADIQARLEASREALSSRGLLSRQLAPQATLFGWPLALLTGNDPGYHGIANYVDENPAYPNFVLDYNCGSRTYDTLQGYNHQGTDFFLWPFYWYKMDHGDVAAVAAADGIILQKDDGNYDRSCAMSGAAWNAVYVQHPDGTTTWYGHLRNGSLTTKAPGDHVLQGEFLGLVGSSGNSTGPHLHFEVYNASNQLIDPWGGPCNSLGGVSWWASQRPYYDSALNALYTHDAAPEFPACPNEEIPHFQDTFTPGQTIYFAAYYRDQLAGQLTNYRVYDAANVLQLSWSGSLTDPPWYAADYWYWFTTLPASGLALGKWRFEADYQGSTVQHEFFVVSPTAVNDASSPRLDLARLGAEPGMGRVQLSFHLPQSGVARLSIFDARGRHVAQLMDGWQTAGAHQAAWEPGTRSAPGVYVARLECAAGAVTRKLCVVR